MTVFPCPVSISYRIFCLKNRIQKHFPYMMRLCVNGANGKISQNKSAIPSAS